MAGLNLAPTPASNALACRIEPRVIRRCQSDAAITMPKVPIAK